MLPYLSREELFLLGVGAGFVAAAALVVVFILAVIK